MTDFGWVTVTAECPAEGCDGEDDVRVFGSHNASIYRSVKCSTCSVTYTIKVVITCSGAATEYVID